MIEPSQSTSFRLRESGKHNRTLRAIGLPLEIKATVPEMAPLRVGVGEMEIAVNYVDVGDGNRVGRAVVLDNFVIPEICKRVNGYGELIGLLDDCQAVITAIQNGIPGCVLPAHAIAVRDAAVRLLISSGIHRIRQ